MDAEKQFRLELTEEQAATVKAATGKDVQAVELSIMELEARIAPMYRTWNPRSGF